VGGACFLLRCAPPISESLRGPYFIHFGVVSGLFARRAVALVDLSSALEPCRFRACFLLGNGWVICVWRGCAWCVLGLAG